MYNPSLLIKLNKALSPIYGNSLLNEDSRRYDEYFCRDCQERFSEDKYNHSKGVCYSCFDKESEAENE